MPSISNNCASGVISNGIFTCAYCMPDFTIVVNGSITTCVATNITNCPITDCVSCNTSSTCQYCKTWYTLYT